MNIFSKITFRNLKKNRVRTLVTIVGILLSTAMFTAVSTSVSSLSRFMINYTLDSSGGWYARFNDLTREQLETLKEDPEVTETVFLQRLGFSYLPDCTNNGKPYLCVEAVETDVTKLLPVHITSGRMPEKENELLLPDHLSSNGGVTYALGDTLTLQLGERIDPDGSLRNNHQEFLTIEDWEPVSDGSSLDMGTERLSYTSEKTYTVTGFYSRPDYEDYSAPGYTALTIASAAADGGSDSYDAYFTVQDGKKLFDFLETQAFTGNYDVNHNLLRCYGYSGESTFNHVIKNLALILIAIIMFGSVSLIYNAFSISVNERTQQFGILASIGATRRQLRWSVLTEGLFLGAVGIPLGILAGIAGMGVTFFFVGDTISRLLRDDSTVRLTLSCSVEALLASALIALLTIMISAWLPARRSLKRSAIETIRQSGEIRLRAKQVKTSRLTQKLFGLEGMIASKNYKRSRNRYRATVISLFISIVLFISTSSFCSYLERSADAVYKDYEFNLTGSINPGDEEDAPSIETIRQELLTVENISKLCFYKNVYAEVYADTDSLTPEYRKLAGETATETDGEQTRLGILVTFLDDAVFREFLEDNGISPAGYWLPDQPKAVLVDNINYYDSKDGRYHISSAFSSGKQMELTLITDSGQTGLVCDTGPNAHPSMCDFTTSMPALYLPYSQKEHLFPDDGAAGNAFDFTVVCSEHAETCTNVGRILRAQNCQFYVTDLAAATESEQMTIFIIDVFSYGFIALISLIAAANVFNTISTNILLRSREFAMLRSVGLEPRGMMRMMNFECLLYGFKGLMYGLPTALLITWLIFKAVSDGVEFPFYIPWLSLAIAIGSVFAVVFATMLYAMNKVRKENTADALKTETI